MSLIISALELAQRHFMAMETGDESLATTAIHAEHVNHEAPDHPPASAQPGLPGFLATSAWLRLAFSDLHFEIVELVADDLCTIAHVTMSGRQTGPFVVFPLGGSPVAFPPTGKRFAVRQCHIFHRDDGLHVDHAAVRDDLGMMTQLGHLPPSPRGLARMAWWNASGRSRKAVAHAVEVARIAAASASVPIGISS